MLLKSAFSLSVVSHPSQGEEERRGKVRVLQATGQTDKGGNRGGRERKGERDMREKERKRVLTRMARHQVYFWVSLSFCS